MTTLILLSLIVLGQQVEVKDCAVDAEGTFYPGVFELEPTLSSLTLHFYAPESESYKRIIVEYNIVLDHPDDSNAVTMLWDSRSGNLPFISVPSGNTDTLIREREQIQEFLQENYHLESVYWVEFQFRGQSTSYCSEPFHYVSHASSVSEIAPE